MPIRVMVPSMPTADDLLPYLRAIDKSKIYCNNGPLVRGLEQRALARQWSISGLNQKTHGACAVSSGTSALELSLRSLGLLAGSQVAVPHLTFRATAQAIVNAGLRPVYLDVDPYHFHMHPSDVPEGVDVAVPVAAYGAPVATAEWENWVRRYPERRVVMDCAGALGNQWVSYDAGVLTCFSLHATKFIGAGEGGLVVGPKESVDKVRQLSSFGDARGATNNRMSEYHAVVALASMDRALEKSARLDEVDGWYRDWLSRLGPDVVLLRRGLSGNATSLLVVALPDDGADCPVNDRVAALLRDQGVETRMWYRPFPQEMASLSDGGQLPLVARVASRTHLGLPFHCDLDEASVRYVCERLSDTLAAIRFCNN
jgi:dTDP-4-amino-4,6-dideoxygalactose transaminase